MKSVSFVIPAFLVGCILCSTCEAMPIPLGEINHDDSGGSRVIASSVEFSWNDHWWTKLLDWGVVTPSDVGKTFTQSAVTSPDFDFFSSMLTSGTDDILYVQLRFPNGSSAGTGAPESYWLNKFIQTETVDFYGWQVTEINLTVNSLTIDTPGSNPNGDGIWTDCVYDVTFSIYGIPEPSTLLLLGLGAVM